MNQFKNQTVLKRIMVFTLVSLAVGSVAQAQTPPTWLEWNGSAAQKPASAPAAETPVTTPMAATTHPLGAPSLGAGDATPASSGQTVIIQNLLNNVSQLQEQVRDLRGQVEEQSNQIQRLQKTQQSGFGSLDDRLTKLEQPGGASAPSSAQSAVPPAPSAISVPAPAASASPSTPVNSASGSKQQNLYNAAFTQLKNGSYDDAIKGFQAAIDADPQGQWTPSALFWQGETYYVQQKRGQADAAYQKILTQFPQSDRVPDALLKTGYIAYDENKNAEARSIFQKVVAQYPQSQAANLAKQRLARMVSEKR
ncbi:MAG: tol-pal system protein YbgF [Halothiobacillus sp.]